MYGIREIGSGKWWDGEGYGPMAAAMGYPSIKAALEVYAGKTITEVVVLGAECPNCESWSGIWEGGQLCPHCGRARLEEIRRSATV